MTPSWVLVHTQTATARQCGDAPKGGWGQLLRHLLLSRIPDEDFWRDALWIHGPERWRKSFNFHLSTHTTHITHITPETRKLKAVVQKKKKKTKWKIASLVHFKNIPGTDAVVNTEVHLPQHTAQRTQPADPESCGLETLHDAAGRGTHETHSGITTTTLKKFKLTEQHRVEQQLQRDMNLFIDLNAALWFLVCPTWYFHRHYNVQEGNCLTKCDTAGSLEIVSVRVC